MPDPLREGLPRLFQHVLDKKQELRLIFEATAGDQADQLLSMPWEIIYIAEIKTHLGLMRHVTLARRLLETVRLSRPVLAPPYRIMHIIAEPDTYDQIDPRLQMGERTAICQAAGTAESYTLIEKPGSVERTLEQLRNQPYQIIHFLGHGIVESAALPQSYLLFASEDNMPQIVTSEQFPTFLSISPGTQIVVLNACHGASVEAANTVALQLVYHGIPYVVAMQSEVLQAAAQVFATIFYAALQKGESLEAALTQSRVEMAAVQGSIDWALPVLYVSAGAAEESALGRTVNAIEHWISDAQGQRQLGNFSIGLGVAHLIVATLLWISGAAPVLTNIWLLAWTLVLLPVALLLALWVRFFGGIALPDLHKWSRSGRAGLWLRIVVSAFIGLWLPTMYAWFTLLLLGAMGFWSVLNVLAQSILLVLLFAPGVLVSLQQIYGHTSGFLSNAKMEKPTMEWEELIGFPASFIMMYGPLVAIWFAPDLTAPPLSNLFVGMLLCGLGYTIRQDTE